MNLTLTITMANPAGNRTAFVEGDVPSERYAAIGAELLKDPELKAEQVGFVCPARFDTSGRLEMMGREFCGNAARSFGLWLGMKLGKTSGDTVPIEISGSSSPLNVTLEDEGAWVSMPVPKQMIEISVISNASKEEELNEMLHFPAVVFEGITHVILEDTEISEELAHSVIKEAARKTNAEAAGAIFVSKGHMVPAVWVDATNSFIWESSCGSGTLATAVWLGRSVKNGTFRLALEQPGGTLKAEIKTQNSKISNALIGGPVTLEPPVLKTICI